MRQHGVPLMLIVLLSGGLFLNALRSEFVWDDGPVIQTNPHIRSLSNAFYFFTPQYWHVLSDEDRGMRGRSYRPLTELSFAVEYAIWRLNPLGWHITSVLWHAINCVLVYFLAHRIFADRRAATVCALLFAAHPIHVEAVVWAKARSELLACMLMLASMLLYLRWMEARPSGVGLYVASVAAFALALASKASAIVLPALLLLYVWCFVPRARRRSALLSLAPFAALLVVFFILRAVTPSMDPTLQVTAYPHALTALTTVGVYLRLLVLPVGLCLHQPNPATLSLLGFGMWRPWAGIALSLLLLVGAAVAYRRSKIVFFALAWLLIGIVPVANIKLLPRLIGEVRAYGPSLGFCILLTELLRRLPALARARVSAPVLDKVAIAVCVGIIAAYSGATLARNMTWRDNFTLWQDTVRKNPGSLDAHRTLAKIYMQRGQRDRALPHLRIAVQMYPEYTWALEQLARLCLEAGLEDEAIQAYEMLLRYHPDDLVARMALGDLYIKYNRLVEAADQFKAVLQHQPTVAAAHQRLGYVAVLQGRYGEAVAEIREAGRLGLDKTAVHHALGTASAGAGRHREAIVEFRQALAADPNRVQTWAAAAESYEKLGDKQQAIRCYQRCVELGGPLVDLARKALARLAPGEATSANLTPAQQR